MLERNGVALIGAQLEAIVGAERRLKLVAQDIVDHFEKRTEALEGKAMVVCMSRRICVELHREIVALRPEWQSEDDDKGAIKVVMTDSASTGDGISPSNVSVCESASAWLA